MKKLTNISREVFGHINDKDVFIFTLKNANGMAVKVMNFGAIITSIKIPSKFGEIEGVLGFDTFEEYFGEEYRKNYPYFGAVIGRNAGRVLNGFFVLNDKKINLTKNLLPHQLHGGVEGFDSKVWEVKSVNEQERSVSFGYLSKDGEEGYPGNLSVVVTYSLTDKDELNVDYYAKTDADTVVNLTQHTYFNFNKDSKDITNHKIQINTSRCLPLNEDLIPIGEEKEVTEYNLDFRTPKNVPVDIDSSFVRKDSEDLVIGRVECEETGIQMEVRTNYPILHIYSAYYAPSLKPKNNRKESGKNAGVCFEAQRYPDALNHPKFPTNKLTSEDVYQYHTSFKFFY